MTKYWNKNEEIVETIVGSILHMGNLGLFLHC